MKVLSETAIKTKLEIKIGSGIIDCKSYTLHLITLSSTESEYVLICDVATLADWLMAMLCFIHLGVNHIDDTATRLGLGDLTLTLT